MPPDLAEIEGGVTSEAKTAREASEANNAAMGKVLLALKAAGIDEKDIQTSRLSLQPQNAPNRPRARSAIVGYRASNRVTVRLHDVTKVAEHDRHAGRRRRQRYRRHQFHGVARPRNCSTRPASRRSPMPAARPRSMPRPPASRSARRSASPRKARPARSRFAKWRSAWPPRRRRWRRAKRRLRSR